MTSVYPLAALGLAAILVQGCATQPRGLAPEGPCADFSFQIYFGEDSAVVNAAARRVVAEAARRLQGCPAPTVSVVGLSDDTGPSEANLTLSRRRAEAVAAALARSGFSAPDFRLQAAGEAGALTPQGQVEPVRRRAEVFIDFPPR